MDTLEGFITSFNILIWMNPLKILQVIVYSQFHLFDRLMRYLETFGNMYMLNSAPFEYFNLLIAIF